MPLKYVILRAAEGASRGTSRGVSRGAMPNLWPRSAVARAKVEFADLEQRSAAALARERGVRAVAPVMPLKLIAPVSLEAAPASASNSWGIQAVGASTSPFTGKGIVPAVLDTGIDPTHPAFAGIEIVRRNFTSEGPDDQHGHGTHCAGTIFGQDVKGLRIGVARGVKKVLIGKVLGKDGGGSDRLVEAINWATENGANVISMSLGIDFPGMVKKLEARGYPIEIATSIALEGYRANVILFERLAGSVAALDAFGKTVVLVAAAGNQSRRQVKPEFEIAVGPPAVSGGFVSVAALQKERGGLAIAPFSNFGARVSGPGVAIVSAKAGGGLASMSGTSMATPHVAGVAVLWMEKLKNEGALNPDLLMSRLIGTASTSSLAAGFDPRDVGAGLVQAPQVSSENA
jgi:subtilisin family serine protease